MNTHKETALAIYEDEVIGYLAVRHHTTPQAIVSCYLQQDGTTPNTSPIDFKIQLEENELQLVRDLIEQAYKKTRY